MKRNSPRLRSEIASCPGRRYRGGELDNAAVFGAGITICQAGSVPIAGTKGNVPVPVYIRLVAQLAPKHRFQRGFDIESEITPPGMRSWITASGGYKLNPDQWSLLHVDAKLWPEFVARALARCGGNAPGNGR